MQYKIGFKLDDGRTLWLKQTYASKSYAEKVMKRERTKLLEMGVKLTIPYVVKVDEKPKTPAKSTSPDYSVIENTIKESKERAVASIKAMPNVCTAKNPRGGEIAVNGNPYKHDYSAVLKNARRYFKDAVVVVCYNKAELWGSRRDAMSFYMQGIYACEGAERERYENIYLDLQDKKDVALDEWY